jgi:hypothetical protein
MDIFKSGWSGSAMSQDDRKKLFWYLKRMTSYTAWSRAAAAFDDFSEVFKKQVVEEPNSPGSIFGPFNWEEDYIEILRAQVWFEQGLETLRNGDRSVWLYNDRGVLADAQMVGEHWFAELIHGGPRCENQYFGKYLDELKTEIRKFQQAGRDIGYCQPKFIDTPAPEFWGEYMECLLNNEIYPRKPDPGVTPERYASTLVFPDPLPEIPPAPRSLLIKSGDPVPTYGIYEPQVKDGCMNYLLQDSEAPPLAEEGATSRPVIWKLIWEDLRYLDGQIPAEERLYFVAPSLAQEAQLMTAPDLVSKITGEVCSQDGFWAVMDELDTKVALRKGSKMPDSGGREVSWVWVGK